MSTKMEERIKRLMDEHIDNYINVLNDRVGGIFLGGVISGIILSYSGFLGYIAGIGTGVILAKKYKYISYQITEKGSIYFSKILQTIKK